MKYIRGFLRLSPDGLLENEESLIRKSVAIVSGAGMGEVNGVYEYRELFNKAGLYQLSSTYQGQPVTFVMYKCKINNTTAKNKFQWFISITPEGLKTG